MTLGASGQEPYPLCQHKVDKTQGNFQYAQNAYNGFSLVTVTDSDFTVEIKGIKKTDEQISLVDLYTVQIKRQIM